MSYPEYSEYNDLIVTLKRSSGETFSVSHYGEYIDSVSISETCVTQGNPLSSGASGSLTLWDHNNKLFKFLIGDLKSFMSGEAQSFIIDVEIKIYCWSSVRTFLGHVIDWQLSFTGGAPSITLNWSVVDNSALPPNTSDPSNPEPAGDKALRDSLMSDAGVKVDSPISALEILHNACTDFYFKVVDPSTGKVLDNSFPVGEEPEFVVDPASTETTQRISASLDANGCRNSVFQRMAANILVNRSLSKSGKKFFASADPPSGKGIIITYSTDQNASTASAPDPKGNDVSIDNLVFTVNAACAEFGNTNSMYRSLSGNLIAIPVQDFKFQTGLANTALNVSVSESPNGNTKVAQSGGVTQTNATSEATANQAINDLKNALTKVMEIEFSCYNVMCFPINDTTHNIYLKAFDENGEEHPVTGNFIATEVTYSLSGGVVEAQVKATSVFSDQTDKANTVVAVDIESKKKKEIPPDDPFTPAGPSYTPTTPSFEEIPSFPIPNPDDFLPPKDDSESKDNSEDTGSGT